VVKFVRKESRFATLKSESVSRRLRLEQIAVDMRPDARRRFLSGGFTIRPGLARNVG
jgi:hypothetical protein